jgi:hypothetical protein
MRNCLCKGIKIFCLDWWFWVHAWNALQSLSCPQYLLSYVKDVGEHVYTNTRGEMLKNEPRKKKFQTLYTNYRFSNSPSMIVAVTNLKHTYSFKLRSAGVTPRTKSPLRRDSFNNQYRIVKMAGKPLDIIY